MKEQNLAAFKLPKNFRGRPAWQVQLWWIVQGTLFALSPQFMYGWRRWLLRLHGARIGNDVRIRPSARITYPWKVTIEDRCWIGDEVVLYSLGEIHIGRDSVISQRSYLCAASHDYERSDFPIYAKPVRVGNGVWIATDVFVGPGVSVADGVVVGVRSVVLSDLPEGMVCHGTPARPVSKRKMV